MADVALFQRRNTDLFSDAAHRFFQRQLHVVTEIGAACRALTTTSAAKDIAENIAKDIAEVGTAAKTAAAAHAALFEARGRTDRRPHASGHQSGFHTLL
ncbi:hypothetical protein [Klebsiella pneumoniae IS46]|nr:hypothetical protein [Klebsiella pneumoniae IS46]